MCAHEYSLEEFQASGKGILSGEGTDGVNGMKHFRHLKAIYVLAGWQQYPGRQLLRLNVVYVGYYTVNRVKLKGQQRQGIKKKIPERCWAKWKRILKPFSVTEVGQTVRFHFLSCFPFIVK